MRKQVSFILKYDQLYFGELQNKVFHIKRSGAVKVNKGPGYYMRKCSKSVSRAEQLASSNINICIQFIIYIIWKKCLIPNSMSINKVRQ